MWHGIFLWFKRDGVLTCKTFIMELLEIIITILAAVIVGVAFYYIFSTRGPWGTLWSFLLILILVGLAAEAWINPVGPVYWGVAWIPTLFVIILFALLLSAAASPLRRPRRPLTETEEEEMEEEGVIALSGFFWIFMIILFAVAMWGIFAR